MRDDPLEVLWPRIADIHLRLRSHVDIHRHHYRGQPWYVVQDHTSGRFFRITPDAYRFVGQLDGSATLESLWNRLEQMETSRGELIRLLAQLYRADLLVGDTFPDTDELIERASALRRRKLAQRWRSPIAIRFPLVDPERFLNATWPLVRPIFSRVGLMFWLGIMVYGGVLAVTHIEGLTEDVIGRVLSADNLLLLIVVFPIVKALHELGHAYAIKATGGEVHEMGIILLVFMPIPYVDASSSSANPDKHQRALVGAAGMLIELAIAVGALMVWVAAEPGVVKAVAYNVILIAGVSTIFFNANPLVRFDGYYILADLVEIPNLGSRAFQYLGYLYQRYCLRLPDATPPVADPAEKRWLIGYALGAFAYRIFIIVAIAWLLLNRFFFFGVLLAIWAVAIMALLPIGKSLLFLFKSQRLNGYRGRSITISTLLVGLLGGLLFIPLPFASVSQGVVWVDQQSWIRTASEGFVSEVLARPQQTVGSASPLLQLENPDLVDQASRLDLFLQELVAQYDAVRYQDRVEGERIASRIRAMASKLVDIEQRRARLLVTAESDGQYVSLLEGDQVGRFLPRGSLVGFVADQQQSVVRVVVPQSDIDLIRNRLQKVELRFASNPGTVFQGRIVRQIPAASQKLPSLALASQGGGDILLDPTAGSASEPAALQSYFQLDVEAQGNVPEQFGGRVGVRFSFGQAPLIQQLYRPVRRTFLSRFG